MKNLIRTRKQWWLVGTAIIVALVVIAVVASERQKPGLNISLSVPSSIISKDRFLVVNAAAHNRTAHAAYQPWSSCTLHVTFYMDNKQIYSQGNGPVCEAATAPIKAGGVSEASLYINPLTYPNGRHHFYIRYQGVKSNTLTLSLAKAASIGSCYKLSSYASPSCDQIALMPEAINVAADESEAAQCEQYLQRLTQNTPLEPIASLSTVNCLKQSANGTYLVMNVPKGRADRWISKLAALFSEKSLPDDYATSMPLSYPTFYTR